MKRCAAVLLAAALLCPFLLTGTLAAQPPQLSAASAILVDADTGRVLYEHNAGQRRLIASITKLMTALVAVEARPDVSELVTIRPEWTGAEGSSIYLKPGEQITLEGLLYGLLMASGNDAALAIAGHCAGDVATFVEWMNEWAAELEMNDTHFANPNGLDSGDHYSTAADMAKLARAVMDRELLVKIVGTKAMAIAGRSFTNHNKLLWQCPGCIGMKTGYTEKAGRTLVSCAQRDGQRLIAVTLNAPDDWRDHAALYEYGFSAYPRRMLALAGKEGWHVKVKGSLVQMAGVCTENDVYYPLAEGERVYAAVNLGREVEAPVKQGAIAGDLTFYLEGEPIGCTYLVFASDVRSDVSDYRGLLQRLRDFFKRT